MKPKISVIIPAYNAEKTIKDTIKAVINQDFPKNKYEIIVVDDGSTDDTVKLIKRFRKVKLIKQKHEGPASARNLGVKNARGEIILFTDADCIPKKNWIKNIIKPFKKKNIVAVAGTYETLNKNKFMAKFVGYEIEQRHKSMRKVNFIDFVGTYNCAYKKLIFLKSRGFNDKSFSAASGEDPELSFKLKEAGYMMVFQPDAVVLHSHPENLRAYLKQKYSRAFWKVFLYYYHPKKIFGDTYTPKTLFPQILPIIISLIIVLISLCIGFIIGYFYPLQISLSMMFLLILILPLLNYDFYYFLWKKEKTMVIPSYFIFLFRNVISVIAIIHGGIYFLFKKLNFIK